MTLQNKTVAIVGGGSGIGLSVARKVVEEGGRPLIGGRSVERLDGALAQLGPDARALPIDTADKASIAAFFERSGPVDHLFISAATYAIGSIHETDDSITESPFRSKFWGQYYTVQQALGALAQDGSIVLMAGAAGARPLKGGSAYAACNSAIEGLGRALAVELAPLRVNTVSPGTIDGHLWRGRPAEIRNAAFAAYRQLSLAGRPGTEEEVADAVIFLIKNRFMTGSTLYTDGGYVLP